MCCICVFCTHSAIRTTPRCAARTHPSLHSHSMLHVSAGLQLTRSCKRVRMHMFSRLLEPEGPYMQLQVVLTRSSKAVAVA